MHEQDQWFNSSETKQYDLFGSDTMFLQMKECARKNRDELAEMLLYHLVNACSSCKRKSPILYKASRADYEQIQMAAFEKLWKNIDRFLEKEENQPNEADSASERAYRERSRQNWLNRVVINAANDTLKKSIIANGGVRQNGEYIEIIHGDAPTREDNTASIFDLIPDKRTGVEDVAVQRAELQNVMDAFFSVASSTRILAAVFYDLLLASVGYAESTTQLLEEINGLTPKKLLDKISDLLDELELEHRMIRKLQERIENERNDSVIQIITPNQFYNRKSTILKNFREKQKDKP